MIYAILNLSHSNESYLERFTEEKWEEFSARYKGNENKILYVTKDIEDVALKDFKEITWRRFYSLHAKSNIRIRVPFTPNDIPLMAENAEKIILEKEKKMKEAIENDKKNHQYALSHNPRLIKNKEEHDLKLQEIDKEFPLDMNEFDAIKKWKEKDYIMPPPTVIKNLKTQYNKSWEEFIILCKHII